MIECCVDHKKHPACWYCLVFAFALGFLTTGLLVAIILGVLN